MPARTSFEPAESARSRRCTWQIATPPHGNPQQRLLDRDDGIARDATSDRSARPRSRSRLPQQSAPQDRGIGIDRDVVFNRRVPLRPADEVAVRILVEAQGAPA